MPAIVKAQTTKQAKASYKARGRPSLTEKEQRQLERAIELEARAEKAREAEKGRAKAAKKRAEQEKKSGKTAEKLGSQRKVDGFGFLASQFHLGAFFGKPKQVIEASRVPDVDDEDFEEEGLDDEELLEAVSDESVANVRMKPNQERDDGLDTVSMPPPPPREVGNAPAPPLRQTENQQMRITAQDLDSFWDELGSGTQISRELNSAGEYDTKFTGIRSASFNSTEFDDDLTAEDLDLLDSLNAGPNMAAQVRQSAVSASTLASHGTRKGPTKSPPKAMLPPALLSKTANNASKTATLQRYCPAGPQLPPARPTQPLSHGKAIGNKTPLATTNPYRPQNAIKGPFMPASTLYCSPDLGFTMTQLEALVDDNIQLTQTMAV